PSDAASTLMKYRGPDGYADISDDESDASLAIIKCVDFERIQIVDREIRPNFVEWSFAEARFVQVVTDAHFSAAANRWRKCLCSQINLKQVISSRNNFADCIFQNACVDDYQACETVFTACRFVDCEIYSLRTVRNLQRRDGELTP